jgi:predicted DNA-binding transcriptional regulator AlpA
MASIQIAIDTPYVTKREFLRRTGMTSSTFDNLRNAGKIPVMEKESARATVLVNQRA